MIDITKDNYKDYLDLDILVFLMTPSQGEVDILTADEKCYHSNFREGDFIASVIPVLNEMEDDPAQNPEVVPAGWSFRSSFVGNYLFYKDGIKKQLEDNYLDVLPDDVLMFDWEMIVKTVKGDKSARIEVMASRLDELKEVIDSLYEALYQFSNQKDTIEFLIKYLESGQWEEDNQSNSLNALLSDIDRIKAKCKEILS